MNLEALFRISCGVYLATSKDNQLMAGCVVNSVIQVTSKNPTLLLSINKKNTTATTILNSRKFGISVLSEKVDMSLIGTFGYYSSKEVDKFKEVHYEMVHDIPIVLNGANAYYGAEVTSVIDAGTHWLFLGKVIETKIISQEKSLTYDQYQEMKKGQDTSDETWICDVCGYIYHGDLTKLDTYICPICGVPKEKFTKV